MSKKGTSRSEDIIWSKEVVEFTTVANEFCKLLESLYAQSRKEFIHNMYKVLTLLQSKAVLLPDVQAEIEFESESFVNEADWHFIDSSVSEKLGAFEIFNDLSEPSGPESYTEITLSECLADTYQDLKDFTQIYQLGNADAVTQAISECKTSYEQLWGPRIMIVIREFHLLIFSEKNLEEDTDETNTTQQGGKSWLDDIFEN